KFLTIYGAMVLHESRHEEALPWLELALACAEHLFGPDHPDLAGPLLSLVHCHSLADRHEDAVLAARRAVEVSVSGMGNRHPRVARSRLALGVALYSVGHNAEAEQELRAVIDLSRETDFAPALLPALGRLGIEL